MAYLTSCIYCNGQVLDQSFHPECRIAYLEDLLYRIQCNRSWRSMGLLDSLTKELVSQNFRPWKEFEKKQNKLKVDALDTKLKQQAWILERQLHMQNWEKENPNPNPPTCEKIK